MKTTFQKYDKMLNNWKSLKTKYGLLLFYASSSSSSTRLVIQWKYSLPNLKFYRKKKLRKKRELKYISLS